MKKKNLRIMSKQYAHLHAMAKTSVKFQNDWPKTVGGVALTSQLLTNGQTDGSQHAYIARANAGATITNSTDPDLDLYCLLRQGMSCSAREGLKRQENLHLKMSSDYVVCCIFLRTFQTYFLHIGKQCGPRSDCSLRSSLIWVHTVCNNDF